MNKLFSYILGFGLMGIMGFFFSVFIFQIGDEYILTNIQTVANDSYSNLGISSQIQTHIDDSLADYRALILPYDLFFLFSWIAVFGMSLITAYKSREDSYMSFFGSITVGLMVFLFVLSFLITIFDWIVLNLIQGVVNFDLTTTPIILFYIDNIGIISFIWASILIIVNKLTFSLIRGKEEDINDFSAPNGEFQK